ncbi:hypothetical protein SDC9_208217 [bioreactor metagenome]|uniref:Uncharacterized protein n=1 Tax=bioreactor metagenome TaxID=1076179 RepID=A0A645JCL6_9ZZZZ
MEKKQYVCPKCSNTSYESDNFKLQVETLPKYLISKIKNL